MQVWQQQPEVPFPAPAVPLPGTPPQPLPPPRLPRVPLSASLCTGVTACTVACSRLLAALPPLCAPSRIFVLRSAGRELTQLAASGPRFKTLADQMTASGFQWTSSSILLKLCKASNVQATLRVSCCHSTPRRRSSISST